MLSTAAQAENTTQRAPNNPLTIVVNRSGHPGPLHPGTYRARIVRAYERVASTGTPQLVVELEAIEGADQGKVVRGYIALTPASVWVLDYFAKAAFPEVQGDLEFEPRDLPGRELKIKVEWPDHSEYPQVARYYPV